MSRPTTPLPSTSNAPNPFISPGPPRSSTHPVNPRHHIPHHPHRTHHHRHHDASVPQSAIQPTTSNPLGELLANSSTKNIDGTRTPAQEQQQRLQEEQDVRDEGEMKREREGDVWSEVEQKRLRRKAADEDLRTTLSTLSTISTNVTRRLDYTYYSLLSSLSSLTSTIQELHKLSNSTTELSTRFKDESASLSDDTTNQIQNTTINFDAQARRIQDLENRIKVGRTEANNLSLRLDAVRTKVESSARRDTEDERRIGRRVKVLWGFLGFWIVLLMILIIVKQRGHGMDVKGGKSVELGNRTWDEKTGSREVHKAWGWESKGNRSQDNGRTSSGERVGASSSRTRSSSKRSSAVDAEATLRFFDEL